MAPNAASNTATLWGRAVHWLVPSRRFAAAALVAEIAAIGLGLPLAIHVVAGALLHALAAHLHNRRA